MGLLNKSPALPFRDAWRKYWPVLLLPVLMPCALAFAGRFIAVDKAAMGIALLGGILPMLWLVSFRDLPQSLFRTALYATMAIALLLKFALR